MRDECIKIQEEMIALGAKGAATNMDIRRHTKGCPLCKEFIQSLGQLEQTEHDLEHYEPPQDMVGGTLATVLTAAKERKRLADAERAQQEVTLPGWGMLAGLWRKIFKRRSA